MQQQGAPSPIAPSLLKLASDGEICGEVWKTEGGSAPRLSLVSAKEGFGECWAAGKGPLPAATRSAEMTCAHAVYAQRNRTCVRRHDPSLGFLNQATAVAKRMTHECNVSECLGNCSPSNACAGLCCSYSCGMPTCARAQLHWSMKMTVMC